MDDFLKEMGWNEELIVYYGDVIFQANRLGKYLLGTEKAITPEIYKDCLNSSGHSNYLHIKPGITDCIKLRDSFIRGLCKKEFIIFADNNLDELEVRKSYSCFLRDLYDKISGKNIEILGDLVTETKCPRVCDILLRNKDKIHKKIEEFNTIRIWMLNESDIIMVAEVIKNNLNDIPLYIKENFINEFEDLVECIELEN